MIYLCLISGELVTQGLHHMSQLCNGHLDELDFEFDHQVDDQFVDQVDDQFDHQVDDQLD